MGEVPEGRRGTGSVEAPAHIRIDQGCIDCRKHLIGMLQHIDIPELSRDLVASPSGPIGPPPPCAPQKAPRWGGAKSPELLVGLISQHFSPDRPAPAGRAIAYEFFLTPPPSYAGGAPTAEGG